MFIIITVLIEGR